MGRSQLKFVVEALDAVHIRAFVVATEDQEAFGALDLVRDEEAYGFVRLLSTMVAEQEVINFWWAAAILEHSQKVVVLTMNVARATYESANNGWGRRDDTDHTS